MAGVIRTNLRTLIPLLKQRIIINAALDSTQVLVLGRRSAPPPLRGDRDILIRWSAPYPIPEQGTGHGRVWYATRRMVSVTVRVRLAVDISDENETWLSDETIGWSKLEDQIVDALDMYMPENSNGDLLVHQPIILIPSSPDPDHDAEDQTRGESTLIFSLVYSPDLDQSIQ